MTKEEAIVKELTPFLLKNISSVEDMIPLLGLSVGALWERALPIISGGKYKFCLLYTSPSPRDVEESRMPSSA